MLDDKFRKTHDAIQHCAASRNLLREAIERPARLVAEEQAFRNSTARERPGE